MQENLYKQAIADAKALRASAIANAKATLQETFAPQVEAIVKQSLREEAEEMEESADEEPIERDVRKKLGSRGENGGKYGVTYTQKSPKLGGGDYPEDLEEAEEMEEAEKMEEARRKKHHEKMEERKHKKEMEEAKKAIDELKGSLNEVNLLNAKLLYMNKIFKTKSLTESQKVKVVGAFDRASNVKEVKNIYATLNESITSKKRQLRESYSGFASKPSGYSQRQLITEADPFVARMQRLAGIN